STAIRLTRRWASPASGLSWRWKGSSTWWSRRASKSAGWPPPQALPLWSRGRRTGSSRVMASPTWYGTWSVECTPSFPGSAGSSGGRRQLARLGEFVLEPIRLMAVPVREGAQPLRLGARANRDVIGELIAGEVHRLRNAHIGPASAQPPPLDLVRIRRSIQDQSRTVAQLESLRLLPEKRSSVNSLVSHFRPLLHLPQQAVAGSPRTPS